MVGQVNGQPIYATRVFEPIQEQLAALGKQRPSRQFRLQAYQLIQGQLSQMILDALMIGEAQRDLSTQEQAGLDQLLAARRQELIRYWGQGSIAVAESRLLEETGLNLKETLAQERQKLLVQRYMHQKLFPKIHVSRKDIERYYRDHYEEYNPPLRRALRLIRVDSPAAADQIDQRLSQGQPFRQIASSPQNKYRHEDGGLMAEAIGNEVFGQAPLNDAMRRLQAGEHSPRVQLEDAYWWVYVESIDPGDAKPLSQAQLEIESLLRRQQFQVLTQRYRQELIQTGSYNPVEEMSAALLEIAITRYYSPPPQPPDPADHQPSP